MKRKPLSDETKRKISEALTGKPKSEEHRRMISRSLTAWWMFHANREYMRQRQKHGRLNPNTPSDV